jgi:hypothetical protein
VPLRSFYTLLVFLSVDIFSYESLLELIEVLVMSLLSKEGIFGILVGMDGEIF